MQVILIGILIAFVVGVLGLFFGLFPAFSPDSQFVQALDSAISFLIQFFDAARWFMPINIFLICIGVIWTVDNWALISRIVQYLVGLVRG